MMNRLKKLDGTTLKLIAMLSMAFDHIGDAFFPDQIWMRAIGRLAMPIFAFCVAEGFVHTRDRKKYLLRLGLFACISELPFDLFSSGRLNLTHQNIMFTFFWAILALLCYEKLTVGGGRKRYVIGVLVLLAFTGTSVLLRLDYNLLGVGLVILFYLLREKGPLLRIGAAMVYHTLLRNMGVYWFGLLGFLPILLYNGQKGKGLKWLFYVFYPVHLLLIFLIKRYLCA